ncbi:hypothetical protein DV735_g3455, partial [Chaetothyriales sp. CBS 134920]
MTGPPVAFSSLPLVRSDDQDKNPTPRLNAWGLYGPSDQVGFLNRQTPSIIAAAASSEIKTGIRQQKPLFHRDAFIKKVYQKKPRIVHDETWTFNTQSSSQWDGLRHFGYQTAGGRFYNNATVDDIAAGDFTLGIQHAAMRGGITGRGILVDFARWATTTDQGRRAVGGKSFASTAITLDWLKQTLAYQGTQIRYGDILIVRSGFFGAWRALTAEQRAALQEARSPSLGGVEQSDEVLRWIWDNFSAVAADHPSFERWPTPLEWSMHEVLLAGWGCNIGELFDLDELSSECERQGRWSFFVSSVPCHVPGGVASPPNAVAIF